MAAPGSGFPAQHLLQAVADGVSLYRIEGWRGGIIVEDQGGIGIIPRPPVKLCASCTFVLSTMLVVGWRAQPAKTFIRI
jgi:hypothetical protein